MNHHPVLWQSFRGSLVLLAFAASASAATYTLTDVGDPMIPSYVSPYQPRINNAGQVAYTLISTFPDYSGYFYSGGTLTRVPTLSDGHDLPGHDNFALGINDGGYVIGDSRINASSDISHAYVSLAAGPSLDISPYPHDDYSTAFDINNSGLVLGGRNNPGPGTPDPLFLYSIPSGTTTNLTALLPVGASALELNDLGQVFGFTGGSAYYWDGVVHLMPGVTGAVTDFNNLGQLAVTSMNTAYLYSGGVETSLGSLGTQLTSEALNDFATVVGSYNSGIKAGVYGDTEFRAWVSYAGAPLVDLNTLIDPALGWTLLTATDVNELGQITGVGYTPDGNYHPYILTPSAVPEPATYGWTALALLAGLLLRRRAWRRA